MKKPFIVVCLILGMSNLCCHSRRQAEALPSETRSPTPASKGDVSIEAGLVYKSGDVKPVARNEFYLLDDDAERILRDANIERKGKLRNRQLNNLDAYATAKVCVNMVTECPSLTDSWDFVQAATKALKPHIIKTITTGFDGKGRFESIPAGNYYVMGIMLRERGFVSWNLKVEVKAEAQAIILDQNNAEMIVQG
jgi:hypothetical protein